MLKRCNDCTNNKVNYIEFLERLKVDVVPGDLTGLSTQIHQGSDEREAVRMGNHMARYNTLIL